MKKNHIFGVVSQNAVDLQVSGLSLRQKTGITLSTGSYHVEGFSAFVAGSIVPCPATFSCRAAAISKRRYVSAVGASGFPSDGESGILCDYCILCPSLFRHNLNLLKFIIAFTICLYYTFSFVPFSVQLYVLGCIYETCNNKLFLL